MIVELVKILEKANVTIGKQIEENTQLQNAVLLLMVVRRKLHVL